MLVGIYDVESCKNFIISNELMDLIWMFKILSLKMFLYRITKVSREIFNYYLKQFTGDVKQVEKQLYDFNGHLLLKTAPRVPPTILK
jgi:hypothetical protein